MAFGKPDSKGRSSGILPGRLGRIARPPAGEPFVCLTRELMRSAAWSGCSIYARHLMDFLIIDHMQHAGRENGRLKATYDQLAERGIPRKLVSSAVQELVELGLLERTSKGGRNMPSLYRLTFLHTADAKPTDEWRRISAEMASGTAEVMKAMRRRARGKSQPRHEAVRLRVVRGGLR